MDFTFDDFLGSFDERTLNKGLELFRREKILTMDIGDDGRIAGLVQGSRRKPYRQDIWATAPRKKKAKVTIVTGLCSCPMQRDCKHVAAVLFDFFATLEAEAQHSAATGIRSQQASADIQPSNLTVSLGSIEESRALDQWLSQLPQTAEQIARIQSTQTARSPEHLLFLLDLDERKRQVSLRLEARPLLKSGHYSTRTRRSFDLSRLAADAGALPDYISSEDRLILAHFLVGRPQVNFQRNYRLKGDLVTEALQLMLQTGRTFKAPAAAHAALERLELGETETLDLMWVTTDDGFFQLRPDTRNLTVISLDPPLYWHKEFSIIGRLELPVAAEQLQHLQHMPEVPASQIDSVVERLQSRLGVALPKPVQKPIRYVETEPRPVLFFDVATAPHEREQFCFAMPCLIYDNVLIELTENSMNELSSDVDEHSFWVDRQPVIVKRDRSVEQICLDELHRAGLRPLTQAERLILPENMENSFIFSLSHEDRPWIDLVTRAVPRWEADGWEICFGDQFPFSNIIVADQRASWFNDIQPSGDNGLLLGIGIDIDGQQYDLLPCLLGLMSEYTPVSLALIPDGNALPVEMEDGATMYLPVERVRSLIGVLHDLFDFVPDEYNTGDRLSIQPQDLVLLDNLDLEARHHESVIKLRKMIDQLRQPALTTTPELPATFQATLRKYQLEGVAWLQLLRQAESGGILADDMGLGKTIQTLAHLCIEKADGRLEKPALLVVPTSLITNWRSEAAQFAPTLRLLVLHGPERHELFEQIEESDLVITTYPLIIRDVDKLEDIQYSQLILDEAQAIKNARARVTQHLCRFSAQQRICLTGTPLENHLGELWSQFNFLNPGLLLDQTSFNRNFRKPIEQHGDDCRQRALHARIAPFMLRRTKLEVATELPLKTVMIKRAVFSPKQRDLYETVRATMDEKVRRLIAQKGLKRSQIEILDALLKLRQICCDPALLKLPTAKKVEESAKLELLKSLLPELIEEGRRVLIFSQFTSMLGRIEACLNANDISYVKLTGTTRDRATPIRRFQNEEVAVFLISLKAGGTGLNLTAADTVIHFDPWWNPAVEDQATDRAYRIGQDKPVFVYRLIVEDSVEEKILKLQESKRALADSVYDGTGKLGYSFSETDLAELFGA